MKCDMVKIRLELSQHSVLRSVSVNMRFGIKSRPLTRSKKSSQRDSPVVGNY